MLQTKVCSNCKEAKLLSEFHKQNSSKDGRRSECKECRKTNETKERQIQLDLIPKGFKLCTICNNEKSLSDFFKSKTGLYGYTSICKECFSKINQQYYQENKKSIIISKKDYYQQNKEKIKKYSKTYRKNHSEYYRKLSKYYYQINKTSLIKKAKKYSKLKNKTDLSFKILKNLRTRISQVIRGKNKSQSTLKLLGCSVAFLKKHLESKFTEGMSWNNYGRGWNGKKEWHIDHKTPCYAFDLLKPEEQIKCFHYTNLQPLWATENLIKNKY